MEYTDNSSFLKLLNPLFGYVYVNWLSQDQGYATNIKINIFTPGAEIDIYVR